MSILLPSFWCFSSFLPLTSTTQTSALSSATEATTTMISDTTRLMLRAWLHLFEQVAGQILRYFLIGLFIFWLQELLDIWLQNDSRIEHQTIEVLLNSEESQWLPATDPE